MLTVVKTPLFSKLAADYWTEEVRAEFATRVAHNAHDGDVIKGTGGLRKIRRSRPGIGKSGGVRIIYFNKRENGEIWLLLIYSKSTNENIPAHILRAIRQEIEDA